MAEEIKQEQKAENSTDKLIQQIDRLEKANSQASELLKRQEEIIARKLLGGDTEAGRQPEKPKEETPSEYARRIMANKL